MNGQPASPAAYGSSPAPVSSPSTTPGSETANGAAVPGGGGASSFSRAKNASVSQPAGSPHTSLAPPPPGRGTRASSATAVFGSDAYWIELPAVTTSNVASSYGNSPMSPTRRSASGSWPRATPSNA